MFRLVGITTPKVQISIWTLSELSKLPLVCESNRKNLMRTDALVAFPYFLLHCENEVSPEIPTRSIRSLHARCLGTFCPTPVKICYCFYPIKIAVLFFGSIQRKLVSLDAPSVLLVSPFQFLLWPLSNRNISFLFGISQALNSHDKSTVSTFYMPNTVSMYWT